MSPYDALMVSLDDVIVQCREARQAIVDDDGLACSLAIAHAAGELACARELLEEVRYLALAAERVRAGG